MERSVSTLHSLLWEYLVVFYTIQDNQMVRYLVILEEDEDECCSEHPISKEPQCYVISLCCCV